MTATRRASAPAIVLGLSFLVAACQTDGPQDLSGQTITLSDEESIAPYETTVNIPTFFPPAFFTDITRRVRDNAIPRDSYAIRDGRGSGEILTAHASGNTRWAGGETYWSEAGFRDKASTFILALREVEPIRNRNALVGYRAVGNHIESGAPCLLGLAAYDLKGSAAAFRSGSFDTSVSAIYCGPDPDPAKFDRMLSELDLVRDRGAYRTALAALGSGETTAPPPMPEQWSAPVRTRNPLVVEWEGFADRLKGVARINDSGVGGEVAFALPDGSWTCEGTFLYGPRRVSGTWSAACTNGLAASGVFESLGSGQGYRGQGKDQEARSVLFLIGPSLPEDGGGTTGDAGI